MIRHLIVIFFLTVLATACIICASAKDALVNVSIACVRTEPRHAAELSTQANFGMPVNVIDTVDGWCEVALPDGYRGYIINNSLTPIDSIGMSQWRASHRLMVDAHSSCVYSDSIKNFKISDIHLGDILQLAPNNSFDNVSQQIAVILPDGRPGIMNTSDAIPLEYAAARYHTPDEAIELVIASALNMHGQAYLWGGTSSVANDCSGLTRISYARAGILLPRDASQQALCGEPVPSLEDARRGDLVLFANDEGKIDHVGLYLGDGEMIHNSGRVRINNIADSSSPKFYGRFPAVIRRPIVFDKQLPGIVYLESSPLYTSSIP